MKVGHKKNKKEGKKHSKTKNESTMVSSTQDMSSKSVEDTVHAQAIPRTTLTIKVTKTAEAPLPTQTADQHILIQPPKEFAPGNDLGNVGKIGVYQIAHSSGISSRPTVDIHWLCFLVVVILYYMRRQ